MKLSAAFFFMILFIQPALSAQYARIAGEGGDLKEGPTDAFSVLQTVPAGQAVIRSNLPLQGYYKVRTVKGAIGWVSADQLIIDLQGDLQGDVQASTEE